MIVVATDDFEVYHEVVGELRERSARFTTVEAGASIPAEARVVIAGPGEEPDTALPVVRAEPGEAREAVETAFDTLREGDGQVVVGIDPGDRPGIAVLVGETVVAAFQVPLADVSSVVEEALAGATDPIVRIGDGARLRGSRLIDDLPDARIELVDETGTTPSLGTGARGMGDVLAAVNIARREGAVIEERDISPTPGEIRTIQERSRQASDGNRTIPTDLARRVAKGALTLEEALSEHGGEASRNSHRNDGASDRSEESGPG
ncbi:MAG: hypothetical protein ABEI31_03665 [Halodesulfurarchaeum sp.]